MRTQCHAYAVVAHVEVRMVVSLVGLEAQANHEGDGVAETVELVLLDDLVTIALPARQRRQTLLHVVVGQPCHFILLANPLRPGSRRASGSRSSRPPR